MNIEETKDSIRTNRHFSDWTDTQLHYLASRLKPIKLSPGEILIKQGDCSTSLYVVFSGRLIIYETSSQNSNQSLIGCVTKGDLIGDVSLITKQPRPSTVYSTRSSVVLELTSDEFENLLMKYPQCAISIASETVKKTILKSNPHKLNSISTIALIKAGENPEFKYFVDEFVKIISSEAKTLYLNSEIIKQHTSSINTSKNYDFNEVIISEWISKQESHYRFIIYELDDTLTEWNRICLKETDQVFFVGLSGKNPELNKFEHAIQSKINKINARKSLILLHNETSTHNTTRQWLDLRQVISHYNIRTKYLPDYGRLVRIISGRSLGLVLSGGGARGFAYIGLFRALEELKISVDFVGGSSVGAGLGALYAMGKDYKEIFDEFHEGFIKFLSYNHYTLPFLSLYNGKAFYEALSGSYGDKNIEDLMLNYFCVSSNLSKNQINVHNTGSLWKAIRASASLPGILPPVINDNLDILVDGGIVNNLPVDLMREHVSDGQIIAVRLSSELNKPGIAADSIQSGYGIALRKFFKKNEKNNMPNISDIIMSSMLLASGHHDKEMIAKADYFIDINTKQFGMLQVKNAKNLADYAYHECMKQLEKSFKRQ